MASIGAYVIWFALGISRAGGVMQLVDIWRDNPHRIKTEILTTIRALPRSRSSPSQRSRS